jgi:hypothetical protein
MPYGLERIGHRPYHQGAIASTVWDKEGMERVSRAGRGRVKANSSIRDAGFTLQRPARDRKPDERLGRETCRPYGTWSCKANSSIRDAGFTLQCPARDRKPDERLGGGNV